MKMSAEIESTTTNLPETLRVPRATGLAFHHGSGPHSDRRTHVLFLIDQLCGIGGAERALLNIVRFLPKDRFRCTVGTFKADATWSGFESFPCPWFHFPLRRTYDWNAFQVALRLRQLIRDQHVDIVHTFFETSDLWGAVVAKLSGARVLISSRRDMGILRTWKHQLAYRVVNPLFDLVLTVSDEVRSFCIQHDLLKPEKVLTLYNAIEIERFGLAKDSSALRGSIGLADASHLICTIGHVRRVKGVDVLVRAAKQVCKEFPRAVFLVIGGVLEPDHLQELMALIESLGLKDNVKFVGPVEDVLPFLTMSDVYCLASRSEGFSNALLEAMACGLPCVATRVGGNPEAVEDGRSGFLVESEDVDALADRIRTLLQQPERAKRMGWEGQLIIKNKFTMPVMISRLADLYDIAR